MYDRYINFAYNEKKANKCAQRNEREKKNRNKFDILSTYVFYSMNFISSHLSSNRICLRVLYGRDRIRFDSELVCVYSFVCLRVCFFTSDNIIKTDKNETAANE